MGQAKAVASPKARLIGTVYLLYFASAIAGSALHGLSTRVDLAAHEAMFRMGIAATLLSTVLYVTMASLFYDLFRPIDRSVSRLGAFFALAGCSVQACCNFFQVAPVVMIHASYLNSFSAEQLGALELLSLKLSRETECIALVFWGCYCAVLGWLIWRSTFLPRVLGALMMLAGAGWLTYLYAPLARRLLVGVAGLGVLAEIALMLWLLVAGVNIERWQASAENSPV